MKVEGELLRRIFQLRKELRLQALGGIVERKAALPATQEQLQGQLTNLQDAFSELISHLLRAAEQEGDAAMIQIFRETQQLLGRFETPPGGPPADEVFQRAMKSLLDKKGSAAVAGEVFEAAMGQIPRRHPGRPTEAEAKAEGELAERLRKLYQKRQLK